MVESNVVRMPNRTDQASPHGHKAGQHQQSVIRHSHELISHRIRMAVAATLERVDDALFDLADHSGSTTQQNLYFDAMREVRLRRDQIKTRFNAQLEQLFDQAMCGATKKSATSDNDSALQLVDESDLEQSLAVVNAVGKLSSHCREALFALDKRMGVLLADPELEQHTNPLGPEPVCQAFGEACKIIESGIEIRLLLFKLFEQQMTRALQEGYQCANDYLVENDVLPEIKTRVRKSPDHSVSSRSADFTSADIPDDSEAADVFGVLQQLLQKQSQLTHGYSQGAPAGTGGANTTSQSAASLTNTQMLSQLTQLQQQPLNFSGPITADAISAAGEINVLRQLQTQGVLVANNAVDGQTIDIVALMFDYILDDAAVPAVIKAQIGRLQIPVLKAALIDKTLFSKKHHPVRQLLDRIAQAGVAWEVDAIDELVTVVDRGVQKITEQFDENVEVFAEVLNELEAVIAEQDQEIASRQERIAKVLKGRDQVAEAKRQVKAAFTERLDGNEIPAFVADFLLRRWSDALLTTYLNEGVQSPLWQQQLQVVDDLIWSLTPKNSVAERKQLIGLLPRLLIQLKASMKKMGLSDAERVDFLNQLAECHTRSVKADALKPAAPAVVAMPTVVSPKDKLDTTQPDSSAGTDVDLSDYDFEDSPFLHPELFADEAESASIDEVSENPDHTYTASEDTTIPRHDVPFKSVLLYDQVAPMDSGGESIAIDESLEDYFKDNAQVMRMLSTTELAVEEIELIDEAHEVFDPTGGAAMATTAELDPVLQSALAEVEALEPGSWLEFSDDDGSVRRLRLQWLSESHEMLTFTDRRGRTVVRKSRYGLAGDILAGRAWILQNTPLFDRAVSSVMDQLGKLTGHT